MVTVEATSLTIIIRSLPVSVEPTHITVLLNIALSLVKVLVLIGQLVPRVGEVLGADLEI